MTYSIEQFKDDIINMNDIVGNTLDSDEKLKLLGKLYINLTKEESGEILESIHYLSQHKGELASIKAHDLLLDGLVDTIVVGYFLYKTKEHQNEKDSITLFNFKNKEDYFTYYVKRLCEIHEQQSFEKNIDEILDLTLLSTQFLDFNYLGAAKDVMDSNLSKFPLKSLVQDPNKEIELIHEQGRYKGCYYEVKKDKNQQERYVFFSDQGKFVKPPSFFREPDLKQFYNGEDVILKTLSQLPIDRISKIVEKL